MINLNGKHYSISADQQSILVLSEGDFRILNKASLVNETAKAIRLVEYKGLICVFCGIRDGIYFYRPTDNGVEATGYYLSHLDKVINMVDCCIYNDTLWIGDGYEFHPFDLDFLEPIIHG